MLIINGVIDKNLTEWLLTGSQTLTPSCLEKKPRQTLRLELVSLDNSWISCIFCSTADGNPEGGKRTSMKDHSHKVTTGMKKSNELLMKQK